MPDFAYSAVDPDYLKKIREYDNQKRATTGRGLTSTDFQALAEAQLNVTADRAVRDRAALNQIDVQQRQLKIAEDQAKAAKTGAIVSGVTGGVSTLALGKMAYDTMKKPPAVPAGGTPIGVTPAVTGATETSGAGAGAGVTAAATEGAPGAAATGMELEAASGAMQADAATFAVTEQAGATGAATASAGSVALEAGGYGAAGYFAGKMIASQVFGANPTISGGVGGAVGGATAGYLVGAEIGSVGGPVGAAVGFVVGGIIGAVTGDSIICTELLRQGLITQREKRGATLYGISSDADVFLGYSHWAAPKVTRMIKSKQYTRWVMLWAHPCIVEMGYQTGQRAKGNFFGHVLLKILEAHCRKYYYQHAVEQEVQ